MNITKKTTRMIAAILTSLFMCSIHMFAVSALDYNDNDLNTASDVASNLSLAQAEYLTEGEILRIAQMQIEGYISTEIENADELVSPTTNFIPVKDIEGNVFATIVPLEHVDYGEIGYIVVGAIADGFKTYEISLNNSELEQIRSMLTEEISITSIDDANQVTTMETRDKDVSLVLIPPMTWLIKVDEENTLYYDVSNGFKSAYDVTDTIDEHTSEILHAYSIIRSDEHESSLRAIIDRGATSVVGTTATTTTEDVRLSCEWTSTSSFLPVTSGSTTYYGGDQNWYTTSSKVSNGCGPVAAANVTCYIAKNHSGYSALYPYSTLAKTNFLAHMNTMYTTIDPSVIGCFNYSTWASRLVSYGSDKGVSLSYRSMPGSSTQTSCATFIKNGLNLDSPVAALNANVNTSSYIYNWHWVTITKYFKNSNGCWIAVSTWGERRSLDFDVYYSYTSASGNSGYVYFVV